MHCILITGGKGTRFGALSQNTPKHLLPIGLSPLLLQTLDQLQDSKYITHIDIVVNWLKDKIISAVPITYNKKIEFIYEYIHQGTYWVSVLNHLTTYSTDDLIMLWVGDTFAYFNIDTFILDCEPEKFNILVFEPKYIKLKRGYFQTDPINNLFLYCEDLIPNNKVKVNAGIYLFRTSLIKPTLEQGLLREDTIIPNLLSQNKVNLIYQDNSYALDINSPQDLWRANMDLFRVDCLRYKYLSQRSQSLVHPTVISSQNISLVNTIISAQSHIGEKVFLENCLVLPNTNIKSHEIHRNAILSSTHKYYFGE